MSRLVIALLAAWLCALAASPAQAHKASDAYLVLRVADRVVEARIDIALRDLDRDLDLDTNADDQLSWREVRTRWHDIAALASHGLRLAADGTPCVAEPDDATAGSATAPALTQHSDGTYAVVRLRWQCAAPVRSLGLEYALFARTDPTHRGIVRLLRATSTLDAPATQLAVLSPGNGWHRFRLEPLPAAVAAASAASVASTAPAATVDADADRSAATAPPPSPFLGFVREGIHHILIGYDHVLFLLSLLLPAVWLSARSDGPRPWRWAPSQDLRATLANVLKVVTAFTVAHSITLALSVLDVVNPPSRWVESIIAASVVLAALNNLWPVVSDARWKLTFVFGLVHGFGFASALKDAGLDRGALAAPLVGFNVGVEVGQLCIVALVLPLAWATRRTRGYRGVFVAGSLAIAVVAALWFVQRAFDLSLIAG